MRKLLFYSLLLFISLNVVSQTRFGIKAGTTISNFSSSTDAGIVPDYSIRIGYMADGFFDVTITTIFSLQANLQYFTGGAKAKITQEFTIPTSSGYSQLTLKTETKFRPAYVSLPVYFKVNLPTGNGKLSLGIGPVASYGVGGKASLKLTDQNQGTTFEGDVKMFSKENVVLKDNAGNTLELEVNDELMKKVNLGLSGMLEYEFSPKIVLGLSYHYGLRNISNTDDEKIRAHTFAIMAGYKF